MLCENVFWVRWISRRYFRLKLETLEKNGRVEIWTETFRNDFVLETSADKVDVTREPSFGENVDG